MRDHKIKKANHGRVTQCIKYTDRFFSIIRVPSLFILLKWDVRFMNLDSTNSQRHNAKNNTESKTKKYAKNKTCKNYTNTI